MMPAHAPRVIHSRKYFYLCAVLAVVLPAAYLIGDFSVGKLLTSQQKDLLPKPTKAQAPTEVQAPPQAQAPPKSL